MLKDPGLYGVGVDYREESGLVQNALILFTPLRCYSKNASLSNTNMHLDGSRALSLGRLHHIIM